MPKVECAWVGVLSNVDCALEKERESARARVIESERARERAREGNRERGDPEDGALSRQVFLTCQRGATARMGSTF